MGESRAAGDKSAVGWGAGGRLHAVAARPAEERAARGGAEHAAPARAEGDTEHGVRRALAEECSARDKPARVARPEAQLAARAAHERAGGGVEGEREHALVRARRRLGSHPNLDPNPDPNPNPDPDPDPTPDPEPNPDPNPDPNPNPNPDPDPNQVRLDRGCERAVLVDWGMARKRESQPGGTISQGSPAYASPEQLTGYNPSSMVAR